MYSKLWLDYEKGPKAKVRSIQVEANDASSLISHATEELNEALVIDAEADLTLELIQTSDKGGDESEAFSVEVNDHTVSIKSSGEEGLLYGAYECIKLLRLGDLVEGFRKNYVPSTPLRMIDHWDNMDGSIERGYSGKSFFFKDEKIIVDERTKMYARFLASIRINAVCFNNVNVVGPATELISPRYYKDLNKLFKIFQSYGIKPYLSLNYASSMDLGGPDTADPYDPEHICWWEEKMTEVYQNLPALGGFVVKADSEGRPGPFTYGRNQADGANMLGRAIAPFGGKIIWRAFVYNCQQDWRDHKTDRARAAYDYFSPLDGAFEPNVYLQIKNGPIDFQVREPISPLFFAMPKTNLILECQIAQEYTGQQIDLCYLLPMWKEILNFPADMASHTVGQRVAIPSAGIAAVANTGDDWNWTGHILAGANFYGFGLLAWDFDVDEKQVAEEYLRLVLGLEGSSLAKVKDMMLASWPTMEKYTAPLGVGFMVTPHYHYGPNIDGYEYDRWGTYHRADWKGIGIDRTETGTDYAHTYPEALGDMYADPEKCPDNLLLFFHHVPYTHVLQSGKTVIQHIYDSHFEGYAEVLAFLETWNSLEGQMDDDIFLHTKERFERQAANAREWCDQINTYFYRKCGIPDKKGRKIYT
jgi:alpha-glucuronidase